MNYQIEKNVSLPVGIKDQGFTGTMRKLEIGDSFVVERKSYSLSYAHQIARRLGIRVSVRSISKSEIRIWRIEGGAA